MKKKQQDAIQLPMQTRDFQIRAEDINVEDRTVELSFSSEFEVMRYGWFGDTWIEILDHSPDSIQLERLRSGAPLLVMHDRAKQVGVIESAEIQSEEKRGRAKARFGKSDYANEIFQDVQDLIRRTVSSGYLIHEITLETERDDGPDMYRVTKWEPVEISLEPTPADYSIGVGRNVDSSKTYPVKVIRNNEQITEEKLEMKKKIKDPENPDRTIEIEIDDPVDATAVTEEVRTKELERIKAIEDVGQRFDMADEARKAIKDGLSVDQFRATALDKLEKTKHIDTKEASLDLSERDISNYSMLRAIQAAITQDWSKAGFELEISREVEKMFNRKAQGFFVPHDIMVKRNVAAGLFKREISSSSGGTGLVGTDLMPQNFIEALRNRTTLINLGALMLSGLVGNVSIPKQTGAATAYWVTEGSDVTTSDSAYGELALSPKTVGAFTPYTRNMLLQSNPSIEALVQNDLINVLGIAIDLGGIHGSGASGQPTGITNTSGIGAVTGTSLDWAAVVEFETDVSAANADIGSMAYLTNATVNGILKTREKATNTARFLAENNEMNGYPVARSNQVASGNMIFGVFSQLVLAFWGALDVMVDPYTNAINGGVIIRAFQSCDVGVRHAGAFSASTNIT